MMKLASTCPNSDMGVVWGLLCLHPNTIKPRYYGSQTKFVRHITFAEFLIIIIIIIIMAPKRTFFLWDILLLLSFLLLLSLPNVVCETYCSVSYYITPTIVGWCIAILRFFFTIINTSPRMQSGDVLLFYVSFSLLLLLLLLLLFFYTFLSALFLGDALIKLYETL
jgi:hypothetical protein